MNQCDECEQGKAANNTVAPPRSLCHESGNFDGTWHWCELLHPHADRHKSYCSRQWS